jgi:hypothetical protein
MQSPSISKVVQPVIIGTTVVQAASSGAAVSDDTLLTRTLTGMISDKL